MKREELEKHFRNVKEFIPEATVVDFQVAWGLMNQIEELEAQLTALRKENEILRRSRDGWKKDARVYAQSVGCAEEDLTALREQLRWRDVEKEKPDMEDCIVWVAGGEDLGPRKDIAFYNSQSKRWGSFRLHDWAGGTITHWMPLPQPPEEK